MPDEKAQPQDWRVLAERLVDEEDQTKLTEIAAQLCHALDEFERDGITPPHRSRNAA
jgi:hypothetical protein